jgi:hypothetical protein
MRLTQAFAGNLITPLKATGVATFLLLPVWGAMFSLRAEDMPWTGLADLVATSMAIAFYVYWSITLSRSARVIFMIPLAAFIVVIGFDSLLYLYDSARFEINLLSPSEPVKYILRRLFLVSIFLTPLALWIFRLQVIPIVNGLVTLLGILFLLLISQFVVTKNLAFYNERTAHLKNEITQYKNVNPKIVILIFDELDSELLRKKISMFPGFYYLEREAVLKGDVYPPANYTHISVPSMLVGSPLRGSQVVGKSILVYPEGEEGYKRLASTENLISMMRHQGFQVSVIGWHLPYCANFAWVIRCIDDAQFGVPGTHLTSLEWLYGKSALLFKFRESIIQKKIKDIDAFGDAFFKDPRNFKLNKIGDVLKTLKTRLAEDTADENYDLIFAHLPCPHLPRLDGKFSKGLVPDYYENLMECDGVINETVRSLNAHRERPWRLIVTSDHWFRPGDWVRNTRPGEYPQFPKKVPIYIADGSKSLVATRLDGGSNVRLPQVVKLLAQPNIEIEKVKHQLLKYDRESVYVEKF